MKVSIGGSPGSKFGWFIMVYFMEKPLQMDDLEVPPISENPYISYMVAGHFRAFMIVKIDNMLDHSDHL